MADESAIDTEPKQNNETSDNQVAEESPGATEAPQSEAPEAAPTNDSVEDKENTSAEPSAQEPPDGAAAASVEGGEAGAESTAAATEEAKTHGEGEDGGAGEKPDAPVANEGDADGAAVTTETEDGEGEAAAVEGEEVPAAAEGAPADGQPGGEGEAATPAEGEAPAAVDEGEATAEGATTEGATAEGATAEGAAAEGATTEGATAEGEAAEGAAPEAGDGEGGAEAATAADGSEEAAAAEGAEIEGAAAVQPTSEEFAEGERPESPPRASEKLSREPTPTAEERMLATDRIDEVDEEAERPDPTSPDAMIATFDELGIDDAEEEADEEEEEDEDYEEEEVEEEEFNREFMIASYKQAMQEREQKVHQNSLLQTKLSDYFRRKKADQGGQPDAGQETEKSITDQEQRYAKFVLNLDELRRGRDTKRQEFDDHIKDLELECETREEEVRLLFQGLLDAKRKVGLKSVSATNGRPFPAVTQKRPDGSGGKAQDPLSTSVDDMLLDEAALEDQVVHVRLDNIGLSNRVRKCETSLKAKEELSEGLHMIDFEQLKIENQTYNEKIEERQEELLKLKKKITNNVQVLTHLKEKLQFVQCKKQEQCESLNELDQILSKRRDQLTRTKQTRDSLRNDNQRLKQNSGLLGNEALLRNFEENVDLVTSKHGRLDSLKMEHSEKTLQCSKLKRKIDVARAQSAQ